MACVICTVFTCAMISPTGLPALISVSLTPIKVNAECLQE
jgi:hypothetical protein